MQTDLQRRAILKRQLAATFRQTAPGLSLRHDREVILNHARELEQQADALEHAAHSDPPLYH
jgi:hypothetical protein